MKIFHNSRLYCLLSAVCLCIFSASCTTERELRASIDGSRQVYGGGIYSDDSPTSVDIGWNIGLIFLTNPGGTIPKKNTSSKAPDANRLYASSNPALYVPAASADNAFIDHLRFEYGLEVINKRSKDGGSKVNLIYLEAPLQALYTHDIGNGTIMGGLGPYLAYGIGGKIKFPGDKVASFSKDDGFKRFDAGVMVSAGYKIKDSFSFRLAYEYGLANIGRNLGDSHVKNRTFSLNVGYPIDKLLGR